MAENNKGLIKSAGRTLDVLEILSEYSDGLSLSELSKKLNIPLSSLHELCATLVIRGYLIRDRTNIYNLGPKVGQLRANYQANNNLILLADTQMEKITQITKETTSFAVLQGNMIVFVHKRPGDGILQVINPVGTRLPAHCTGSGKIMLAYLAEEEIDKLYPKEKLENITNNSVKTKTELKEELKRIYKLGYAFNNQESETGVWAVASCIRDHEGKPIGSLSVVAPRARILTKDHSGWELLVRDASKDISYKLGFHEDK
jgi:DNA-binding IclR family transcriptional regulator